MKEGFATFFEFLGIELVRSKSIKSRGDRATMKIDSLGNENSQVYPDWQMMDFFVTDVKQYVFYTDSDEYSTPMTFYVERPYDIGYHFNSIAYSKGSFCAFTFTFGKINRSNESFGYSRISAANVLVHVRRECIYEGSEIVSGRQVKRVFLFALFKKPIISPI